jgi:hypothetical protein
MSDKSGIMLVAVGESHTAAACEAARSVRKHSPTLLIDIFTDSPQNCDFAFDRIHKVDSPHIRSKVDYMHRSRFARTLYLDNDIRIVNDITEAFQLLDRFDIAASHAHARNRTEVKTVWRRNLPDAFPQLNSGVLLFRNTPNVLALLQEWQRRYHSEGFKKDQVVLRELLWTSDLQIYVLPPEYNLRYRKYLALWSRKEATPKILHFQEFHKKSRAKDLLNRILLSSRS